jgi:TRAP-type C4-dicarboxylate transport system permease small subunit
MLKILRKVIDKLLEAGLVLSFTVLAICVIWQVVSRYVVGIPATFTEETSRFAVIWLSLLGTAYAGGRMEHMAYDILATKLHGRALLNHLRAIALITLLFSAAVFVYGGLKLVLRAFEVEQLSATLEVPMGYVYACIPIAGVCMVFYQLAIMISPASFKAADEVEEAIEHARQEIPT